MPGSADLHQVALLHGGPVVPGRAAGRDLLGAHALPVRDLVALLVQVPAEALGAARLLLGRGGAVAALGVAHVLRESAFELAELGVERLDPVGDRDGGVARIGRDAGHVRAAAGVLGVAAGLDGLRQGGVRLGDRVPVAAFGVVADLDRLAALGEPVERGRGALVGRDLRGRLAVGLRVERVDAVGLALDLGGLDLGGGPDYGADVGVDSEAGGAERVDGAADLPPVGEAVAAVREVPGPDAPTPPSSGRHENLRRAVAAARAVDERALFVGVGNRERARLGPCARGGGVHCDVHACSLSHSLFCREGACRR